MTLNEEALLIVKNDAGEVAHDSLVVAPKALSILGNDLALKILRELGKEPACAMDLAKRMKMNARHGEQKIYYHLRKLEAAGFVKQIGTENRYGMTAKLYETVSSVISTKILEHNGHPIEPQLKVAVDSKVNEFLKPFVISGKLNATVIMGHPDPHGKYDMPARSGAHAFDLALFLGSLLHEVKFPNYKLDVEAKEEDLKDNLILFGSPKGNVVIDRINDGLPAHFDRTKGWAIVSKRTGKAYDDPRVGVIVKMANPFNKNKKLLLISGIRTRGVRAAVMAFTREPAAIAKAVDSRTGEAMRIVMGLDRDGDGMIDSYKFLE